MDISDTITPDSTQINADDLIGGPVTVTVTDVSRGNAEQPVNIKIAEVPGRAYRPSKSMRRVLVAAWGKDAKQYVGRRLTLFRNPDITFGREKVGGIQISHLSHLDKPLRVPLTVRRGKREPFTVQPLVEAVPTETPVLQSQAPTLTVSQIEGATGLDTLRAMWAHATTPELQQAIRDRKTTLETQPLDPARDMDPPFEAGGAQ